MKQAFWVEPEEKTKSLVPNNICLYWTAQSFAETEQNKQCWENSILKIPRGDHLPSDKSGSMCAFIVNGPVEIWLKNMKFYI